MTPSKQSNLYSALLAHTHSTLITDVSTSLWPAVTCKTRIIHGSARNLTGEFLERLSLGLWDQKGGEDTAQHEQSVDLKDVVEPWRGVGLGSTADTEGTNDDLGNDGTNFSCGG